VESWHGIINSFFHESWRGKVVRNLKLEGIGKTTAVFNTIDIFSKEFLPQAGMHGGVNWRGGRGVEPENTSITECISRLQTILNTSKDDI
jgi:hypothetical protein